MDALVRGWEVVIGLEVHAQVATLTKLFSSSPTAFGAEPNTQVSFYDAAMPGMLPVLNGCAVDQAIRTGIGINGQINRISRFDRKNYFYPDLPAGYQISQLYNPIVTGGYVEIQLQDGAMRTINIERIHIEQDAGKSVHDLSPDNSYVDLNRAGIPLMEIVSKPDMRSSYEAMHYVKKLRTILRYIGTCDGNMEQGNLRADANISIRRPGAALGNRVEIKNLNSIKFIGQALDYEIERQIEVTENGERVSQETRLFDSNIGETRLMRSKEDAEDYRYFPEPDLKPVFLSNDRIARIMDDMPELPDARRLRFMNEYKLSLSDTNVLVEDRMVADRFEMAVRASKHGAEKSAKYIANWIIGDLFAYLNREGRSIDETGFPIEYIAELVDLILDSTISGKIAKTVFAEMTENGAAPRDVVKKLGLTQISDEGPIITAIETVLATNTEQLEKYRAGRTQLFGFFVGMVMKELQGKGKPELVNKLLREKLGY
ncbi:MAG: Asp-tRNA(Asn)/Glu-tRNA(Gln) amidotransferase subunit GatB [Holosporales bacterium]|jgi:aspartyl-tRNA(Asn)/glutamyl-tRNA(Gln) amidotransferase subunit B|nr:Asp-tRNA(Asn)/Glu-tRNA(Gln) amidotransferase subunit GatB [Holosporales bacterium]